MPPDHGSSGSGSSRIKPRDRPLKQAQTARCSDRKIRLLHTPLLLCDQRLQPLGYLAWAACGKDPGFTPPGLLGHARRTARYSAAEVNALAFEGPAPDAAALSIQWHRALDVADALIQLLPAAHVGEAVLSADGTLLQIGPDDVIRDLEADRVRFHAGRIGGALPQLK